MCERCDSAGGLGYVPVTDEGGHVSVEMCGCLRAKVAGARAGLPTAYLDCTWASWVEVPQLAANVAALRAWAGDPPLVILCAGARHNLGSGKTRALATVVREWRIAGRLTTYTTMSRLLAVEKSRMDGRDVSGRDAVECQEYEGLLALDDVGAEHETDWSRSVFEELLDARYANARPTLAATNLGEADVRQRYPRAWSRFHEGLWLEWAAPDFRRSEIAGRKP